jgi:superfamily II DNA or RNA helicase
MSQKQTEIQESHLETLFNFYKTGNKHALAHLAMRYGKTKFTLDLLKRLFVGKPTVLIAYPDNKLKDTWKEECIKWNYSNSNIIYTNFSSLHKYEHETPDIIICDEVHSLSPRELDIIHILITNDPKILFLGLSGTISPDTRDRIGVPIVVEYSTLTGIQDGILSDYQVTVHLVDLDTKIKTSNKKGKMLSEKQKYDNYTFVITKMKEQGRNFKFLALSRNRLSLSSIGKIEYTKKLLKELSDKRVIVFTGLNKVADALGIPSYHSDSSNRNQFDGFLSGKLNKLALSAMGKMGVTYPNLDSVILLNFTYNAEESSQILNRAINLDYSGKIADLHIIVLDEPAERKKVQESLSMLDKNKIKYVYEN